jgi:hypothetical protein
MAVILSACPGKPAPETPVPPEETADRAVCGDGWCWAWPAGTGLTYRDVLAVSPDEAILLAHEGWVVRYAAGQFESLGRVDGLPPGRGRSRLPALARTTDDALWVTTSTGLHRYAEGTWSTIETGVEVPLFGVVARGDALVVVAGEDGTVVLEGRSAPEPEFARTYSDLLSPGMVVHTGEDLWLGGLRGRLVRKSEGYRASPDPPKGPNWSGGWVDSTGRAWLLDHDAFSGTGGVHLAGPSGPPVRVPVDALGTPIAIGGAGQQAWVLAERDGVPQVLRSEGERLIVDDAPLPELGRGVSLADVDAVGNTVFVVGSDGVLLQRSADEWSVAGGSPRGASVLAMGSPKPMLATERGAVLERVPEGWRDRTDWTGTHSRPEVFSIDPSGEIWALDSGAVQHFDGSGWTASSLEGATRLTAAGPGRAWAVARAELFQWTGSAWEPAGFERRVTTVLWADETCVWVSGAGFVARRHDGAWTVFELETSMYGIRAIGATGPDEAWFADDRTVWRFDGSAPVAMDPPADLLAGRRVAGLHVEPGEAWLVGDEGLVLHWKAGVWTEMDVPGVPWTTGVQVTDDAVWLYGRFGVLQRPR